MTEEVERADLAALLAELEERKVLATVRNRLGDGEDPLAIFRECEEGMRHVGVAYERGEYFLTALVMAGEIFRQVTEIARPSFTGTADRPTGRVVLLGTVEGDIHDLGKNILNMLLSCHGFTVHDLGVDVAPEHFLSAYREVQPQIIGLSAMLSSAHESMRDTVLLLRREGQVEPAKASIVIGGGRIDAEACRYVQADYWAADAISGVRLFQLLVSSGRP